MLYPLFLGALFVVAEHWVLLRRHWAVRHRPRPSELPMIESLRADVATRAWGAL
jgi:hypothetical protein